MRVYWQEAADNTAYITDLPMTLQGKQHHRWETISNGVSGIGSIGEPRQTWLDSSWFADDGVYLLQIEEVALLPKENRQVTYDYRSNTFTGLPAYVRLKEAVPCGTGLFLEFEMQSSDGAIHGNVFGSRIGIIQAPAIPMTKMRKTRASIIFTITLLSKTMRTARSHSP